jgi:hypothetical protein
MIPAKSRLAHKTKCSMQFLAQYPGGHREGISIACAAIQRRKYGVKVALDRPLWDATLVRFTNVSVFGENP